MAGEEEGVLPKKEEGLLQYGAGHMDYKENLLFCVTCGVGIWRDSAISAG